jgi:mannosyltransferase OCH1-like enzyme
MIPKLLHWCWFGRTNHDAERKEKYRQAADSRKLLEECGYRVQCWNEDFMPMNSYLQRALEKKMWANASNYLRLWAVYNFGGIYVDADVVVLKPFDPLLQHRLFFGWTDPNWINNGIFGGERQHPILKEMMDALLTSYDGQEAAHYSSPGLVTDYLKGKRGVTYSPEPRDYGDFVLYPEEYFEPIHWNDPEVTYNKTGDQTFTIHLWSKWWNG